LLCHNILVKPGWLGEITADEEFLELLEEKKVIPEEKELLEKYILYITYIEDCFNLLLL
jgi:hypothetical protein